MNNPDRKNLPRLKKSWHHPLAQSVGGRRSVAINTQEHDAYHHAFGHQPPCIALRRLLYAAVKNNGYSMMIDPATKLCDVLTPTHWKDVYREDAFARNQIRTDERGRTEAALAVYHLLRYLDTERAEITYAIGRLAGLKEVHGMRSAMDFFRASDPLTAMNQMVKEQVGRSGKRRYKWVDPMMESVRIEVERLTENREVERQTLARREKMIGLLTMQNGRIAKYQTSATSSLREHADILAKLGDRGKIDMSQCD